MEVLNMKRVFSGVQPTGNIHLGNYLGALRQFVELQDDHECLYCIVDLHAITVPQDPKVLKEHILDVAALYLAVGELSRMTQFKAKSHNKESAPTGLFTYPLLMAADILLYDVDVVPVGNDQKQHIELTRDIAVRVNNTRKKTFVVPEGRYLKEGARIMALDDPTQKMSKSAENIHSRISLLDDPAKIKKSIMKATTDSEGVVRFDVETKPGISNLMNIYSVLSGKSLDEIEAAYAGKGYGDFKKDLVVVVTEALAPIKARYEEIRYSDELIEILKDGAQRANAIARPVMQRVKDNFGLGL